MNWLYWIGLIILIFLIYFHFSKIERLSEKYVYLTFILIVIYFIGTPVFYESLPRFEDAWTHSYLAKKMFDNKKVISQISTYEQYPGTFLFFGFLFQILPSFYVMKIFPLVIYVLELIVIYLIFKHLFNSKISFLASVLYVFFNWTVEDNHFSPQFLMLYIYLLFIFIMVKFLPEKNKKIKLLIITSFFTLAIVFSHPGTPIFLIMILVSALVLCKKFRNVLLPISAFLLIVFIGYHLYQSAILASFITMVKQFFQILISGSSFSRTSERFFSSYFDRQIFLSARIGITLFSMIIGGLGLLLAYKKGYKLGTKFFLAWTFAIIPFIIFEGVVLKGELHERFVLISSLPLAGLAAYFLVESKAKVWILIILLVISPIYFIAKYGNEAFESESLEKLKVDCFYTTFNSDCDKRQEVVDSQLYYEIQLYFGKVHYTVNRESIMAASTYMDKSIKDILNLMEGYISDMKLDRIYSTKDAGVYR
jgi:hypothetical protein